MSLLAISTGLVGNLFIGAGLLAVVVVLLVPKLKRRRPDDVTDLDR